MMQPYAFPYIGYFCLIEESDVFVFYDDVNYKKRDWINRNRILINGHPHNFTTPLSKGSQNKLICNIQTHSFEDFKRKFLKQVQRTYRNPHSTKSAISMFMMSSAPKTNQFPMWQ
ncbi:hypothetical protein E8F11_04475 [Pseudomonas sp. BN417]|nr:hypothetical protein [Pseudomonas sp. BN417]